MIVRSWTGKISENNVTDYVSHLENTVFPELKKLSGYETSYVLTRKHNDTIEVQVLTFWDSITSVRAFAGENPSIAVVPPTAQSLLTEWDHDVKHYDIANAPY